MYSISRILRTYNRKRKSPYSCDVFDDIVMFKSDPVRNERRNVALLLEYLESQSKTIRRRQGRWRKKTFMWKNRRSLGYVGFLFELLGIAPLYPQNQILCRNKIQEYLRTHNCIHERRCAGTVWGIGCDRESHSCSFCSRWQIDQTPSQWALEISNMMIPEVFIEIISCDYISSGCWCRN